MTFQKFILGLVVAFGLPWLLLIVIPFGKMSNLEAVSFDEDEDGRVGIYSSDQQHYQFGSAVYGANGCYVCHTQLIRPTYAGSDMWRDNWAGQNKDADDQDTRRESVPQDYAKETFAHIGINRVGQDLSSVGYRLEKEAASLGLSPEAFIYRRLLAPRDFVGKHWSTCPSQPQLFKKASPFAKSQNVVTFENAEGELQAYVPKKEAKALTRYLLSLKKDNQVPASMSYKPAK